jgi:ketosteroid isomerase-like protein
MSTEQNGRTALRMIAEMAEGRLDEALITEDITWWVPGYGTLAKEVFLEMANAFRKRLKGPLVMTVLGVTAQSDRVSVEAESFATLDNGKTYNNTYHFLFQFRDGRICHAK